MSVNSHSAFRLAEIGVKMNHYHVVSYEMYFDDFRFQLNEELSLLFDHGNRTLRKKQEKSKAKSCRKYLRNTICKIVMLWTVIRNDFISVKNPLIFHTIW